MRALVSSVLIASVLTACATRESESTGTPVLMAWANEADVDLRDPVELASASTDEPEVETSEPGKTEPAKLRGSRESEREFWSDPKVRRRFLASYIPETQIEPRVEPDDEETVRQLYDLIAVDKLVEAERLALANRSETGSAVFDFFLAQILVQQERYEEALAPYETAVQKFPKYRRAWDVLSQLYYSREQFTDAAAAFAEVIRLGGHNSETYGHLGACHLKAGDYVAAESALRQATMLDSGSIKWQLGLAEALFEQEQFEAANSLVKSLLMRDPGDVSLWSRQAQIFDRLKQPLKAAQNLEMVAQLGGATPDTMHNLGRIYANQKLFGLAVESFGRELELDPQADVERLLNTAEFMGKRGANVETRNLLQRISDAAGDRMTEEQETRLLKLRYRIDAAEGVAGAEAAKVLHELVDLNPLDGEALMLLAKHYSRSDMIDVDTNVEQAIIFFERVAEVEGYGFEAQMLHGELLVKKNRFGEALPLLEGAYKLQPREFLEEYIATVKRAAARAK